jgi:hypothetical protein
LRGNLSHVAPGIGNRAVCYCNDCQAYLYWLKRRELLDRQGGSHVVQWPAAHVALTDGLDALRCVRLGSRGLHRWYAGCCRWPIGNSLGPGAPFIGVLETAIDPALSSSQRDALFGPVTAFVWGKYAVGGMPTHAEATASPQTILRTIGKLGAWWLRGWSKPSPVFDEQKRPLAVPEVLTSIERTQLAERVSQWGGALA